MAQRVIRKFLRNLAKIEKNQVNELEEAIEKLLKKENELLDETRTITDVLKTANVPSNVLNRMDSEPGYYGPSLEACIRIGLAIGCDAKGIDEILSARGFARLSKGGGRKYRRYRILVKAILSENESPLEDRVTIFRKHYRVMVVIKHK